MHGPGFLVVGLVVAALIGYSVAYPREAWKMLREWGGIMAYMALIGGAAAFLVWGIYRLVSYGHGGT